MNTMPEKKKKRTPRRRLRIVLYSIVVIIIFAATNSTFNQIWRQFQNYQQIRQITGRLKHYPAPDGIRYATLDCAVACVNYAFPAYLIDPASAHAFQVNSPYALSFHSVHWSADSRYVALNGTTHYSSGKLLLFDLDAGHEIYVKGNDPCAMFTMNYCAMNEVLAVAPVSPLILTREGTFIHMNDGNSHRLYPQVSGVPLQVRWLPSEQRMFLLMVEPQTPNGQGKIVLKGYFADNEGANAVPVFSLNADTSEAWYDAYNLVNNRPALCEWNADETGVECEINGQHYSLKDTEVRP